MRDRTIIIAICLVLATTVCEGLKIKYPELKIINPDPSEIFFGQSNAISGDIMVISEYVYYRDPATGQWNHQALVSSGAYYYATHAIDGDTIIVGVKNADVGGNVQIGAVYVHERNQGGPDNWGLAATLTHPEPGYNDSFGQAVAISGDTILVGAPEDTILPGSRQGSAHIFRRNPAQADQWILMKSMTGHDSVNAYYGGSVDLSGNMAVVGAPGTPLDCEPQSECGLVWVYYRDHGGDGNWGLVKTFQPTGTTTSDGFGRRVVTDGVTLAVGALTDDTIAYFGGSVYVYSRNQAGEDNWGQVAKLWPPWAYSHLAFGGSMNVEGDLLVIGAGEIDNVMVHHRMRGGEDCWGLIFLVQPSDPASGSPKRFGSRINLDKERLCIGAIYDDEAGSFAAGAVYVMNALPSFLGDFETGNLLAWTVVQTLADSFNELLVSRAITGDFASCDYEDASGNYSYLGQTFHASDGGLGGVPISNLTDLYWKNESLASTIAPYDSEDPDGDGVQNSLDADAFDSSVQ